MRNILTLSPSKGERQTGFGLTALAAHIRRILDERASHSAPKSRFLDELEDHMAEDAAEDTLKTIVSWARFAELFSYDDDAASFSLENPT